MKSFRVSLLVLVPTVARADLVTVDDSFGLVRALIILLTSLISQMCLGILVAALAIATIITFSRRTDGVKEGIKLFRTFILSALSVIGLCLVFIITGLTMWCIWRVYLS